MTEIQNGRVTIREVYDQVDKVRSEIGGKLDDLADDLQVHYKEANQRDMRIQALEIWVKHNAADINTCVKDAMDAHVGTQHKEVQLTGFKVWVMWAIGIFAAIAIGEAFFTRLIAQFF